VQKNSIAHGQPDCDCKVAQNISEAVLGVWATYFRILVNMLYSSILPASWASGQPISESLNSNDVLVLIVMIITESGCEILSKIYEPLQGQG
jgi:hypothetical protein